MSNDLLSTPARWNVDPSATHARFVARTLWGLIPVRGSLTAPAKVSGDSRCCLP